MNYFNFQVKVQQFIQRDRQKLISKRCEYIIKYAEIALREQDLPSADANQIANNLSNLGQVYNREDPSTDVLVRTKTPSVHSSTNTCKSKYKYVYI